MNEKYLVGLVTPEILTAAESDTMHPVRLDLGASTALEIRYDFFDEKLWPKLSDRIEKVAPGKLQIGTIRLKRDGGTFPNNRETERQELWKKILGEPKVPQWLDLERDCLHEFDELNKLAAVRKVQLLISEHNFSRIPGEQELENFARDVSRFKAPGLKIAAMSNDADDCGRLYKFIKKYSKKFKLFAAFGMGDTGKSSRLWSLKEGANLTYGAIGCAHAPGQIDIMTMKTALDQWDTFQSEIDISAFLAKF